jgi:hypothetical protein
LISALRASLTGRSYGVLCIIRENELENLEFPFSSLNSAITPIEQFFIRGQFSRAEIKSTNEF